MKKIFVSLLLISCIVSMVSCSNKNEKEYDTYCYTINQIIKDIDFEKGEISDSRIVLYQDDHEVYNQHFDGFNGDYEILHVRKEENKIFFVFNGAVDDESGIVYINDKSNDFMDGIHSLERIGGNSYRYSTVK